MLVEPPAILLGLLEPDGKAPETRMGDPDDARSLVNRFLFEDQGRAIQRALVRGNLDGNNPYGATKPSGQKWEANLNFLFGKARVNRAVSTYSALFAGVENYANFQTGYQKTNPESQQWNLIIARNFHDMIKTWGAGWDWNMQHRIKQMVIEGFAPVLCGQGDDWRFKSLDASCIKVPRGTPSTLDERCDCVVLLDTVRCHELWKKIADEKASTDRGWNRDAVKKAIRNSGQNVGSENWRITPWEKWQQMLVAHDLAWGYARTDVIEIAHVFVNEFAKGNEKTISHFIVTQNPPNGDNKAENDYLFKHVRCYNNYADILHVFFSNIGDGTWHTVKGLAFDCFKHDVQMNRLLCRMLDRAFIDSTAFMASPTANNSDKLDNTVIGGAVVRLAAGAQMIQTGFAGSSAGVQDCYRLIQNVANANTGASNPRTIMRDDGKGEQPTLGQVRAQIAQDTQLSNDQVRMDYLDMDQLYARMYWVAARRGTTDKAAQDFQEKCLRAGLPREALDQMESITANRMSGYGSQSMKEAVVDQLMKLAPTLPEDGKNNLVNLAIMAYGENPALVDILNPKRAQLTPDDSQIWDENEAMRTGATTPPPIVPGQNNVKHVQGHLDIAAEVLTPIREALEAGQNDPQALMDAYRFATVIGKHIEAHLAFIMTDPIRRQLGKQFQAQLQYIVSFHGKLRQAIRNAVSEQRIAQQQEENAMALGVETQAKLQSAEVQNQIKIQKARLDMALKTQKAAVSNRLAAVNTVASNARETAKAASQIQLDRAKTASKGGE